MLPFLPPAVPFRLNLLVAARLLPFFVKRASLADVIALATPAESEKGTLDMAPGEIVDAVKKVTARPWRMRGRRCLREGLLGYRYLVRAGHKPVLHFAVIPSSMATSKPRAHCWITIDGEIVLNPPSEPMVELFHHDATGSVPDRFAGRGMAWS